MDGPSSVGTSQHPFIAPPHACGCSATNTLQLTRRGCAPSQAAAQSDLAFLEATVETQVFVNEGQLRVARSGLRQHASGSFLPVRH